MVVSQRSILVIDDDVISHELICMLLEAEGYAVHGVESGEAAVEYLNSGAMVDAVLTDMQMPGLSGTELAAALRAAAKSLRLIAMSASRPGEEKLAGYDGFLLKPFEPADFTAVLASAPAETSATAAQVDDVLNPAVFQKLSASMKRPQLLELYAACLDDSKRRIERMRASAKAGDDDAFRKEAHAIKGACSMLGAVRMAKIAAAMETGGVGGCDSVDTTLNEFLRECNLVEDMLLSDQATQ